MSTKEERLRKKVWTHGDLVTDLATWLDVDGFVCGETRFGRAWYENSPIPDVLKIRKSYTRWDVQIYECKASRPDFLGELRNGKWQDYLGMSSRFYFATPVYGVVKEQSEIPETAGWIVRGAVGWKVIQVPKVREFKPEPNQLLALLMNYDDRVKAGQRQIDMLKKAKHVHNVAANEKMHARMHKVEALIKDGWTMRGRLRDAKATFERITGIKTAGYSWLHDLERKLGTAEAGVDVEALRRIDRDLTRLGDYVKALLPEQPNGGA